MRLHLMTFNILEGGTKLGQPLSQTANVVRAGETDVVVLQEQDGNAETICGLLGFQCRTVSRTVAILSRWPIVEHLTHGAHIRIPPARDIWVFGVHLQPFPYGPYSLRDDSALSVSSLIDTAHKARGGQIAEVLAEMRLQLERGATVFLAGDFNEPSHLDWTKRAAATGLHFGREIVWPTSFGVTSACLLDSFRVVHPDEVKVPGHTWTPVPGNNEVHDRIDFVYHTGRNVRVLGVRVIGENRKVSDKAVVPYPSDHRAVVAEYEF